MSEPIKSIITYKGKEPGESIILDEVNSQLTVKMFTDTGGHITVTIPWHDNQQIQIAYITALGLAAPWWNEA